MLIFLLFFCSLLHAKGSHQEIFSDIYNSERGGSDSAEEDFLEVELGLENAAPYIEFLQSFLKKNQIKTVVDVGCGDWKSSQYIDWTGIEYIGYDVVPFVIKKNQKKFSAPNIRFFHKNFLETDLPKADLLLCKEVLQHLSNQDILQFISQLSKFKFCLITNEVYPGILTSDNPDISAGGIHKIDLTMRPFRLFAKKVLNYMSEGEVHQVVLIDHSIYFP